MDKHGKAGWDHRREQLERIETREERAAEQDRPAVDESRGCPQC